MKTNLALLIIFTLFTDTPTYAGTPPQWTHANSSGTSGVNAGLAIKVDNTRTPFITGQFSSTLWFEKSALKSAGGLDILIRHLGAPQELWALSAGGPGDDIGYDLALDQASNACVTGYFSNTATFHSTDGKSQTVNGSGQTVFIAKYDKTGVLQWLHTGDSGTGLNQSQGAAIQASDGSCYITGVTQAAITFSSTDGSQHVVPGLWTWHMFLVKYDANGNFQWGQTNAASPNSIAHKVAADASGVYVTGWFEGSATFSSHNGLNKTITGFSGPVQSYPDYPNDAFIVKYDFNGNLKWANHIGGYKALAVDIATSHNGQVSIAGAIGNINGSASQRQTIATSQPGGKAINLGGGVYTAHLNGDIVIATYNQYGALLKAQRLGGAQWENGTGVTYDRHNNLYVTGAFQSSLTVGPTVLTGAQTHNLFVLEYSGTGLVWAKKADGGAIASNAWGEAGYPRLTTIDHANNVLVIGGYQGSAVFDGLTLSSHGVEDIFVGRLMQAAP